MYVCAEVECLKEEGKRKERRRFWSWVEGEKGKGGRGGEVG